jgi:hypothetical protein
MKQLRLLSKICINSRLVSSTDPFIPKSLGRKRLGPRNEIDKSEHLCGFAGLCGLFKGQNESQMPIEFAIDYDQNRVLYMAYDYASIL